MTDSSMGGSGRQLDTPHKAFVRELHRDEPRFVAMAAYIRGAGKSDNRPGESS